MADADLDLGNIDAALGYLVAHGHMKLETAQAILDREIRLRRLAMEAEDLRREISARQDRRN
jgi:hypothetical protein